MNFKLKLAFVIYLTISIAMLGIGFVYVFASEFMGFHADVIQTQWKNVDSLAQTLYLGMMRTEGAGFLAVGTAMLFLLFIPYLKREQWACWAISIIGIVECLPTLIANYHVSTVSQGSPPWLFMLTLILLLILGLCLSLAGLSQNQNRSKITLAEEKS